jgi:glycerophosphoryl diester phosphodiesterase
MDGIKSIATCIALCLMSAATLSAAEPQWNIRDVPRESVTVIAHRGAGYLAPENTMEALELTWSMGGIPEVDVRTTSDGVIVMFHDNNFARILPDASEEMKKKRLEDLTYDEARRLDIGAFRGQRFAGQKIVTLEEICDALRQDRWRRVYIDVKNVDFELLARKTEGLHEQIVLATGKDEEARRWMEIAPRSGTLLWMGLGKATDADIERRLDALRESDFEGVTHLQIHVRFDDDGTTTPSGEYLRNAGNELRRHHIEFQTMPWDVKEDKVEYYKRLLDLGTAGLGTDRPDIAMQALDEYYAHPPAGAWNVRDHIPFEKILVQAHRGYGNAGPEGSLESFERAWKLNMVPEADLRMTRDGVIVSFHDNNLARILPDAPAELKKKGIEELTFAETQQLDIGRYRGEAFAGQRIISLAGMIEVLDAHPERMLYIDIKEIDFEVLARQTEGHHRQLILASTKYEELKTWKRLAPRSRTLHWMGGTQADLEQRLASLRDVKFAGIDQLQIHVRIGDDGGMSPSESFLKRTGDELREHGILFQTLSWTQGDKPETYRRLLDLGCASFATDFPVETMNAIRAYYDERERITLRSLLEEMIDRDRVARFPEPLYRSLQASSYNRESVRRDEPGWFADSDGLGFIRTETVDGKTEWVIMEHEGPGCITRIWTPFFYYDFNERVGPNVRIYLDGSETPVIDESLIKLVTGQAFVKPPFAAFTARAGDLYLPIPFAESCKITMMNKPFYHIINYRAYPAGTVVETFTRAAYEAADADRIGRVLYEASGRNSGQMGAIREDVAAGASVELMLPDGPSVVRELTLRIKSAAGDASLRSTVLTMTADDEQMIWCPVGDFFCCADSLHPFHTWERTVSEDGTMTCRWVMPYRRSATIRVANFGQQPVTVDLTAAVEPWRWDDRSMHFHANWRPDDIVPGTPFQDWNFIDIQGKGVYVGDAWTVLNIEDGWWGEGDEKIYVDDAWDKGFPTHFGTGTEDYYGWAGGVNPTRDDEFDEPFLANVRVGGLGPAGLTRGYNICTRTRSLDAIPFHSRLRFDIEASFGTQMREPWDLLGYSAVTFWYAVPGATSNRGSQAQEAAKPIVSIPELQKISDAIQTKAQQTGK